MLTRYVCLALFAVSFPTVLLAQNVAPSPATNVPPVANPPARPTPGTIDLVNSCVYVKVDKTGLGHAHAVIGRLSGGQVLLGQPQQAGSIKFDLRSFTADTVDARRYVGLENELDRDTHQKVNANMHGESVLDIKRYPEAVFVIQSAARLPGGDNQAGIYDINGELTLHGAKRPVRFQAKAEISNHMILLRGSFPLVQTDFGIKPYAVALGAVGVADKLHIWGDIWIYP